MQVIVKPGQNPWAFQDVVERTFELDPSRSMLVCCLSCCLLLFVLLLFVLLLDFLVACCCFSCCCPCFSWCLFPLTVLVLFYINELAAECLRLSSSFSLWYFQFVPFRMLHSPFCLSLFLLLLVRVSLVSCPCFSCCLSLFFLLLTRVGCSHSVANALFVAYDADGSGFIDLKEFTHLCKSYDPRIEPGEIAQGFKSVGVLNGKMDPPHFYKWLAMTFDGDKRDILVVVALMVVT